MRHRKGKFELYAAGQSGMQEYWYIHQPFQVNIRLTRPPTLDSTPARIVFTNLFLRLFKKTSGLFSAQEGPPWRETRLLKILHRSPDGLASKPHKRYYVLCFASIKAIPSTNESGGRWFTPSRIYRLPIVWF